MRVMILLFGQQYLSILLLFIQIDIKNTVLSFVFMNPQPALETTNNKKHYYHYHKHYDDVHTKQQQQNQGLWKQISITKVTPKSNIRKSLSILSLSVSLSPPPASTTIINIKNNTSSSSLLCTIPHKQQKRLDYNYPIIWKRLNEMISIIYHGLLLPIIYSFIIDGWYNNNHNDKTILYFWDDDHFWKRINHYNYNYNNQQNTNNNDSIIINTNNNSTLGMCVMKTIELLGPLYIKLGQSLLTRNGIIQSQYLLNILKLSLHDSIQPFSNHIAINIIRHELLNKLKQQEGSSSTYTEIDINQLINSLSSSSNHNDNDINYNMIGSASIGQVYKGYLPNYGAVAIKVQRPNIRQCIEYDEQLLVFISSTLQSIPSIQLFTLQQLTSIIPILNNRKQPQQQKSKKSNTTNTSVTKAGLMFTTKLVNGVTEIMNRLYEELNFTNEVYNMKLFYSLYSHNRRNGINKNIQVVVPEVIESLCTDQIIVMEYIDGMKLTSFVKQQNQTTPLSSSLVHYDDVMNQKQQQVENLSIIKEGIQCTLSQLLDTGILHADPHPGNLLKVNISLLKDYKKSKNINKKDTNIIKLGYLDFGMISTIPIQVRDGLICVVVQLIFAKNVVGVVDMLNELQLLSNETLQQNRFELIQSFNETLLNVLQYNNNTLSTVTDIPILQFDKLLYNLISLITRYEFQIPPYFLNNARALTTLEGMAKDIDNTFNVLNIIYPYSIQRLLKNPTKSIIIQQTLIDFITIPKLKSNIRLIDPYVFRNDVLNEYTSSTTKGLQDTEKNNNIDSIKVISFRKIQQIINDISFYTKYPKYQVIWDVITQSSLRMKWNVVSLVTQTLYWNAVSFVSKYTNGFIQFLSYCFIRRRPRQKGIHSQYDALGDIPRYNNNGNNPWWNLGRL